MTDNKKFVAIKVKEDVYNDLIELKKVLIQNGYNSFPKEFLDFLEKKKFDVKKVTMGNMISLLTNCLLFLAGEK